MVWVSFGSVRRLVFCAFNVLVSSFPFSDEDIERMNSLCREVEILFLKTDRNGFNHAVADVKGHPCGLVQIRYRNCFIDIPPLDSGGQLLFPRPLLTLCPHDGKIHPATLFHEIAHLLSCGKYMKAGDNHFLHTCGTAIYSYKVSNGLFLTTSKTGFAISNEIMTDMTAKLLLDSLFCESSLFSTPRLLRINNVEHFLLQHGLSRQAAIYHYLSDSITAKTTLNKALEKIVLT